MFSGNEGMEMEIITIKVKGNLKELNIFKQGRPGNFHPRIPKEQVPDS